MRPQKSAVSVHYSVQNCLITQINVQSSNTPAGLLPRDIGSQTAANHNLVKQATTAIQSLPDPTRLHLSPPSHSPSLLLHRCSIPSSRHLLPLVLLHPPYSPLPSSSRCHSQPPEPKQVPLPSSPRVCSQTPPTPHPPPPQCQRTPRRSVDNLVPGFLTPHVTYQALLM